MVGPFIYSFNKVLRGFPDGPGLRLFLPMQGGVGSVLSWGVKTPHVSEP